MFDLISRRRGEGRELSRFREQLDFPGKTDRSGPGMKGPISGAPCQGKKVTLQISTFQTKTSRKS